METVGERHDVLTSGYLAGNFQCSLDSIGACGARELQRVIHAAGLKDMLVKSLKKGLFCGCSHIQTVYDTVFGQVLQQCLLEYSVVMAIVQGAGTSKKVDVFHTVLGGKYSVFSLAEYDGERTDVPTYFRFHTIKNFKFCSHFCVPV